MMSLVAYAIGLYGSQDITNQWQYFSLGVEYESDLIPNEIIMTVGSSGYDLFDEMYFGTITAGSYIDFDNLSFEYGNTGVTDNKSSNILLYPNPANNFEAISHAIGSKVSILNILGQEIRSCSITSNKQVLDISELSEGTFVIRIEQKSVVTTQKLSVTH